MRRLDFIKSQERKGSRILKVVSLFGVIVGHVPQRSLERETIMFRRNFLKTAAACVFGAVFFNQPGCQILRFTTPKKRLIASRKEFLTLLGFSEKDIKKLSIFDQRRICSRFGGLKKGDLSRTSGSQFTLNKKSILRCIADEQKA